MERRSLTSNLPTERAVSGPKRYDYVPSTDDWRYSRDGGQMGTLLEQELSRALGRKVELGLDHISEAVE